MYVDWDEVFAMAGFFMAFAIGMAVIASIVILIAWPVAAKTCTDKWEGSGYESDFGFFSGCRIQLSDGTWAPESRFINMREVS